LFKSWSPGVRRGHNKENHIYICLYRKKSSPEQHSNFNQTFPWVKGILNCSNLGAGPLQSRDNYKNAKMGWGHLKIFSRTTEPEELIFT
jgi:hypothetical protein